MNPMPSEEEDWSMESYSSEHSMPGAFAGPSFGPETTLATQQPVDPPAQYPQLSAPQQMDLRPPTAQQFAHQRPAAIPLSVLNRGQKRVASFGQNDATPAGQRGYYRPDTNPDFKSRGHMLGFATVALGLGAVLGARLGGVYGGIAGTLFAGAATNGYRALLHGLEKTPEGKREALISGTWSVVAAGAGGYLLYATRKRAAEGEMTPNRDSGEDSCATKNGRRSCGIRAII